MNRVLMFAFAFVFGGSSLVAQYRPGPPPGDPWTYRNGDPGTWDRSWNNRPMPRSGACFFTDRNFSGNRFCVRSGDRLSRLPGNFGDNISSIQVFGRGAVRVFDDRDFRGVNAVIRGGVPDLRNLPSKPGHTWNNRISSVTVR